MIRSKDLYMDMQEKQPLPYQDVEVVTDKGTTHKAYKRAWGNGFTDSETYVSIEGVIKWRYMLSTNVISKNR